MEPRKLRKLLETLREFGVTSYRDPDLTLQLGASLVPGPEGDVENFEGELQLPPGTPDPRDAIRALYEKHEKKLRRAS